MKPKPIYVYCKFGKGTLLGYVKYMPVNDYTVKMSALLYADGGVRIL